MYPRTALLCTVHAAERELTFSSNKVKFDVLQLILFSSIENKGIRTLALKDISNFQDTSHAVLLGAYKEM